MPLRRAIARLLFPLRYRRTALTLVAIASVMSLRSSWQSQWLSGVLWILAIVGWWWAAGRTNVQRGRDLAIDNPWWPSVLTGAVAFAVFLWRIDELPFVAIIDPLRDAGLAPRLLFESVSPDVHGWGFGQSYGTVLTVFAGLFRPIGGDTVWSFRIPSALCGALGVVFAHRALRESGFKRASWGAALLLLTHPLVQLFARSELCVIHVVPVAAGLILAANRALSFGGDRARSLLALGLGFSCGLHSSARALVFALFPLLVLTIVVEARRSRDSRATAIRATWLAAAGLFIGFGPRLLHTNAVTFFLGNGKVDASLAGGAAFDLQALFHRYVVSLGGYFHFPVDYVSSSMAHSLWPVWLVAAFVTGIAAACAVPGASRRLGILLAYVVATAAFTCSAVASVPNYAYRMMPQLTASAMVLALALEYPWAAAFQGRLSTFSRFLSRGLGLLLFASVLATATSGIVRFFLREEGAFYLAEDNGKTFQNIFLEQGLRLAQRVTHRGESVCLRLSPSNAQYLSGLPHGQERTMFHLAHRKVEVSSDASANDSTFDILAACGETLDSASWNQTLCDPRERYVCAAEGGRITLRVSPHFTKR